MKNTSQKRIYFSEESKFMNKIYVILVSVFLVIVIIGCSTQNNNTIQTKPTLETTQNSKSSEQTNNDIVFPGDALTYLSSMEITGQNLFITESIKNIYENYSKSQNDELLKGLNPVDILRLYNQACEDKNIEMQVSLQELPADVTRSQFIQEIQNDQTSKEVEKEILQRFHEFKGKIIERLVNDKKAYIVIEKNGWYRMEKNKNGIWKLGWMARA